MRFTATNSFDNEFDLTTTNDLSSLEIKKNSSEDNCLIQSKKNKHIYFSKFILKKNLRYKIVCEVNFYCSHTKYIPRLKFRREKLSKKTQTKNQESVIIDLQEGEVSQRFWFLIGFFNSFKHLVDIGEFKQSYEVAPKDLLETIKKFDTPQKQDFIKNLINEGIVNDDWIRSITFETRKRVIRIFLHLLKNGTTHKGQSIREWYREQNIPSSKGDEAIWHHFLKTNDWIIGLNDLIFIDHLINEAKVGVEDTNGKGSPKADFIGISNYTTLIELKTSDTKIFKEVSNKGRTNTWEFSSDFISGVSQCLGQKSVWDTSYLNKDMVNDNNKIESKDEIYNQDVKSIFIIGTRYKEFPHDNNKDHKIKSQTFELFRRNNRNIEILTYDELFERAYHIVFSEKIEKDWYQNPKFDIKL